MYFPGFMSKWTFRNAFARYGKGETIVKAK
jgi:hypothetical protein